LGQFADEAEVSQYAGGEDEGEAGALAVEPHQPAAKAADDDSRENDGDHEDEGGTIAVKHISGDGERA